MCEEEWEGGVLTSDQKVCLCVVRDWESQTDRTNKAAAQLSDQQP